MVRFGVVTPKYDCLDVGFGSKAEVGRRFAPRPLRPRKRTSESRTVMSALGQKATRTSFDRRVSNRKHF
jgi:hypothetical protein